MTKIFGREREITHFKHRINTGKGQLLGFYGSPGLGKTTLLAEFKRIGELFTPYVASIDFTPGHETARQTIVGTLVEIIRQLESSEHTTMPKQFWDIRTSYSPFIPMLNRLGYEEKDMEGEAFTSFLETIREQDANGTNELSKEDFEYLMFTFSQGVQKLPTVSARLGKAAQEGEDDPLIVLLFDALEHTTPEIHQWLISLSQEVLGEYVYLVGFGREPIEGLLTQNLRLFNDTAMQTYLIKRYYIDEHETLEHLAQVAQGLPFALDLAGRYSTQFPYADPAILNSPGNDPSKILHYMIEQYLAQYDLLIEDEYDEDRHRMYYVLRYAPIMQELSEASLKALLHNLSGLDELFGEDTTVDYGFLYRQALDHAFVPNGSFHEVTQDVARKYLQEQEPARWMELNARAARYYEAQGKPKLAKQHTNTTETDNWSLAFEKIFTAFDNNDFQQARELRASLDQIEMPATTAPWVNLVDAILAYQDEEFETAETNIDKLLEEKNLPNQVSERLQQWQELIANQPQLEQNIVALRMRFRYAVQTGNQPMVASALLGLSAEALDRYEYDKARTYLEQAVVIYRELNITLGEANALRKLGALTLKQTRYDESYAYLEEALTKYREINDVWGEASTLRKLGELNLEQDRYDDSLLCLQDALTKYQEIKDRWGEANTLEDLGILARLQGRYDDAKKDLERALLLYQALGIKRSEASARNNLGKLAKVQDDFEIAESHLKQALNTYTEIESQLGAANALNDLGELARIQGHFDEAQDYLDQAYDLYQTIGSPLGEALVLLSKGRLLIDHDEPHDALSTLKQALELYRQIGYQLGEAHTLRDMGAVTQNMDQRSRSERYHRQAFRIFHRLNHIEAAAELAKSLLESKVASEDWRGMQEWIDALKELVSDPSLAIDEDYSDFIEDTEVTMKLKVKG